MPVDIRTLTAPPARGAPGDIDTLFVPAGIAGGTMPVGEATVLRSITDYEATGAVRADETTVYDGLDAFFREGGRQAVIARYDPDAGTGVDTIDEALALFTEQYGGGQVVSWTETPDATLYGKLQDWASANKRYALLDVELTDDTLTELTAKAALLPAQNADYGALFGPWVDIPAQAGVIGGAARQAPATAVIAALIARADALGNPNRAAAGRDFPLQYATDTVATVALSDADAVTARAAGVNPIREKFGVLVCDGFQTSIDQSADTPFWQVNPGRARMWLQWRAYSAGLNYEYKPLDGRGRLAGQLKSDLDAICLGLWQADGLFGDSPADAFAVNVSVAVNTPATEALGELHAVVEARFSLHARDVIIDLVSVPVNGNVS